MERETEEHPRAENRRTLREEDRKVEDHSRRRR